MSIIVAYLTLPFFVLSLIYGLRGKSNQSIQITLISVLFLNSFIFSPLLMVNNKDTYEYSGWSGVGNFDFSFNSMIVTLSSGMIIYVIICLLSVFLQKILSIKSIEFQNKSPKVKRKLPKITKYDIGFVASSLFLIVFYFLMFGLRLGVSGVETPTELHLSGIVHYFRTYVAIFVVIFFFTKSRQDNFEFVLILFYALVAGLTSSSRGTVGLPLAILIIISVFGKKYFKALIALLIMVFGWVLVTMSRDYTFTEDIFSSLDVILYTLPLIFSAGLGLHLDSLSGRLGGAHEQVVAGMLMDSNNCNNYMGFIKGTQLCNDVVGDGYGMDLTDTPFGIGMSNITNFVIFSNYSIVLLIFSAICFYLLIVMLNRSTKSIYSALANRPLYIMLNVMGVYLIYIGPLSFYYVFIILLLGFSLFKKLFRRVSIN